MKTPVLCLILLGLSSVAFADVSPFYKANTKVKGKKTNERRLHDIHGSIEQDSAMASIFNSRELNVGPRPVVGSKGRPHLGLGAKGKGKGGFKWKNRSTSSSKSSKSSKKGKGKGGKGKGSKGAVGIIHNPIPTHPGIPTMPVAVPPVATPVMPPVNAISNDAISADTPTNNAISADTPTNAVSSVKTPTVIKSPSSPVINSADTPSNVINSADTISVDDPASADTPTVDTPSVDDPATGDSPSGDDGTPAGALVLNFIMESTDVKSLDDQANFQLTTLLTLNGDLFDVIEENGVPTRGPVNLGDFRGHCTITGIEQYLCNYELYFRTRGEVGAGGFIIKGPVSGPASVAVVTGTSFDYSIYDTGSVTLTQDPNQRWLLGRTDLYLAAS